MRLLLDTSILIDVLRKSKGRGELVAGFARAGHSLSTTALNIAEVYAGMRPREAAATETLLSTLECHELTASAGRLAGQFVSDWRRKGRTLELPDTMVAAICMEKNCVLVTDNRKDFPMPGVQLYPLP